MVVAYVEINAMLGGDFCGVIWAKYQLESLNIQAVYLSRRHQPLAQCLLIDFLVERFGGDIAPWDLEYLN